MTVHVATSPDGPWVPLVGFDISFDPGEPTVVEAAYYPVPDMIKLSRAFTITAEQVRRAFGLFERLLQPPRSQLIHNGRKPTARRKR